MGRFIKERFISQDAERFVGGVGNLIVYDGWYDKGDESGISEGDELGISETSVNKYQFNGS